MAGMFKRRWKLCIQQALMSCSNKSFENCSNCIILNVQQSLVFKSFVTYPRVVPTLTQEVETAVTDGMKIRKHPGKLTIGTVALPPRLISAIEIVLEDHKPSELAEQAESLKRYIKCRHAPPEESFLRDKAKAVYEDLKAKARIDDSFLSDEDRLEVERRRQIKALKRVRQITYHWKPLDYRGSLCLHYLVGFAPEQYAVLTSIFKEINARIPDFKPKTFFDFGSGVGTALWAVRLWESTLKEYVCVDSSSDMNNLSSLLLCDGHENKAMSPKGVFFKQFLPASHGNKYDIVVSAFSLLDLPDAATRLSTVLNLWMKTDGVLVLVEQGTNAGFQAINEARDFILDKCSDEKTPAHVFAPCPHDMICPRFIGDNTPCNFWINYQPLSFITKTISKTLYSYVVLRRGERPKQEAWPRLVREPLLRHKHVVCRFCSPSGNLEEVVVTPKKHGKTLYKCVKVSKWGDLLPVTLHSNDAPDDDDGT